MRNPLPPHTVDIMATIELFARDVWALGLAWPWLSIPVALGMGFLALCFVLGLIYD